MKVDVFWDVFLPCGLFYDTVNISGYTVLNDRITGEQRNGDDLEGSHDLSEVLYPGTCLERQTKTMRNIMTFELNTSEHKHTALPVHETAQL
jgi:hypothetical protein